MWHWWFPLQHWLAIHTGTDNEASSYYAAFSGWLSDLGEITLIGAALAFYKRATCHTWWCPRHGRFDLRDNSTGLVFRLCRRCHPAHHGKRLTRDRIVSIHKRNQAARANKRLAPRADATTRPPPQ